MSNITDSFGSMVFGDEAMKARLPQDVYAALRSSQRYGTRLKRSEADVVATAMKDWAVEKGATHFTYWFQPLTGITAE